MTIYRGVGGVNREIKQQFRGVGGVNREIKQQYRGVGGVNRKVFSSWYGQLYDAGNEYITKTGGWIAGYQYYSNGTITKNSADITMYSATRQDTYMENNTAIDVTNYSKLKATVHLVITGYKGIFRLGVNSAKAQMDSYFVAQAYRQIDNGGIVDVTLEVDIASLTGSKFIVCKCETYNDSPASTVKAVISKIWLE